jgi:hypothetical protein
MSDERALVMKMRLAVYDFEIGETDKNGGTRGRRVDVPARKEFVMKRCGCPGRPVLPLPALSSAASP